MIFAGPDKGGGHFKALKNWEHRSYKKFVIPTQVGIYCHAVSDFHLSPCRGVPLCQGFVVQAMDTRLRGYDERECGCDEERKCGILVPLILTALGGEWRVKRAEGWLSVDSILFSHPLSAMLTSPFISPTKIYDFCGAR